jgi:hypothetical protein
MYNPESAMIKGILGLLSKKPQGAGGAGSTSKKKATPKAAQVGETSNFLLQDLELMVQSPPPSAAIQNLEQGSSAIVEEMSLKWALKIPLNW